MINHARTLLMNVGSNKRQIGSPGEEYVPSYRPKVLTSVLLAIRRILFGSDPDRLYLNYRLREYMTLLHSTELEEYILALDSRVTYYPTRDDVFFPGTFVNTVTQVSGSSQLSLSLQGDPVANQQLGRASHTYRLAVVGSEQVKVNTLTTPLQEDLVAVTVNNGLSSLIPLPGSGLTARISTPDVLTTSVWLVEARVRPTRNMADVVTLLRTNLGATRLLELFGAAPEEPYKTFRNLWFDHPAAAYQLGGLLLAVIYRTDAIQRIE
jgi:hypothetical protein